ncbi:MAG: hypothetical protein CVV33_10515, partial [Methanomicrobiales archaeon HGW-Methanomicrobiales-4]
MSKLQTKNRILRKKTLPLRKYLILLIILPIVTSAILIGCLGETGNSYSWTEKADTLSKLG